MCLFNFFYNHNVIGSTKLDHNKAMDLLKTPSVQSLLDSDLESVESFQYLDIEEVNLEYL